MLREALHAGLTHEQFWALTPKEWAQAIDAAAWRMRHEHDRDMRLAYVMAAQQRAKRMTPLKRLLSPPPKAKPLRGAELEARKAEFEELAQRMMPNARRGTGQRKDTDSA